MQHNDVAGRAFTFAALGVATGLNGIDDGSVGAWAADAEFFEFFDECAFAVASGRTSEHLARFHAVGFYYIVGRKCWQQCIVFATVNPQETVEHDNFALSFKDFVASRYSNSYRRALEFGGAHLARECTATDEIIELLVVVATADRFAGDVCRANGFVSFLGASTFGFKLTNGTIFDTIKPFNKVCSSGNRLPAQVDAVGTHVGDAPFLVELLCRVHGGAAAVSKLAVGFLLQGACSERRSGVAGARCFGDGADGIGSIG